MKVKLVSRYLKLSFIMIGIYLIINLLSINAYSRRD